LSDYSDLEVAPETVLVRGLIEADDSFVEAIEPRGVDPERFKGAMRALATGVVIVTVEDDGHVWGLTINSCCSISANPPQILVSLAHTASCRAALLESRRFGLSILAVEQRDLAELGAVPGGRKHVDVFAERATAADAPAMIAGALAHLDCVVSEVFEVSDHTLVIGVVRDALVAGEPREPLLYHDRAFHRLGPPLSTESEER
jgi:flavin reductase (DIM6/NTAB) family NADH-FMN oxidoreductase RutF